VSLRAYKSKRAIEQQPHILKSKCAGVIPQLKRSRSASTQIKRESSAITQIKATRVCHGILTTRMAEQVCVLENSTRQTLPHGGSRGEKRSRFLFVDPRTVFVRNVHLLFLGFPRITSCTGVINEIDTKLSWILIHHRRSTVILCR